MTEQPTRTSDEPVAGPVALVTGSTSGIGLAVAELLSDKGYRVVLHSRATSREGELLAERLPRAHYIRADLSEDHQRRRLIEETIAATGRLDALVNNAGSSRIVPHDDLAAATPETWRRLYEINTIAPFHLVALAEEHLRAASSIERPAAVVNVASHAGVRPKGASIPYAASKAALVHTTKLLAIALAPAIRVNAVAPGLVDTPLTATWADARAEWRERAPMGRPAKPEDVALVVLALLQLPYVTGEILMTDGGLNLR